ncbi:vitamin B12-dependent ribonucleotide reductase [Candidatus Woesearchaeota archaeon]|nr:vitamin B12-dependent ribonucleotide reductase [Candidatus Woesearchaeota archaeon]
MNDHVLTEHAPPGISIERRFSRADVKALDSLEYDQRTSVITEPDGTVVFELKDIEVPKTWSQLATDIIVSKYFRKAGVPETVHETSARQVVFRIANKIRTVGQQKGYFKTTEDAEAFEEELSSMLITQRAAFNSPVWFNCGLDRYGIKGSGCTYYWDPATQEAIQTTDAYTRPQCSACFIQSVEDDLMSIFELAKNEAKLFKYGSGTGTNFSKLRGHQEKLSGGGLSSGMMSFLEVLDRGAGATKSGGTTRRAAKMACLDLDHPEIKDFITWKVKEEKKVKILIDAGYSSDFNGEAYHTVAGQNANNSVRIPDSFMEAVRANGQWQTTFRTTGKVCEEFNARELMKHICEAAWACADPGVQFDDIINDWHTCPNTDRIRASNPCSEYMFLDDSACNLASINLMKFTGDDGTFDVEGFRHACRIFIIAQEIIVELASYPTKAIAKNTYEYRPLGLGYANLGTYLMVNGIPYDSERGFNNAAAITAIMCGNAYKTSAEIASIVGPFAGFSKNREPMMRVMNKHRDAAYKIDVRHCPTDILEAAREDWDEAVRLGEIHGYRNAQTTVLAPTGTIGLLMDCDTTGVEPDFALVKWKKLAGGGYFKIVNNSIILVLKNLGYGDAQIADIKIYMLGHGTLSGAPHVNPDKLQTLGFTIDQIQEAEKYVNKMQSLDDWTPHINPKTLKAKGLTDAQLREASIYIGGAQTVEGAPHVKDEDVPIFDCANRCGIGKRYIDPMGHIKMEAAVQPFISGSISKTVNLPNDATVKDIENIYVEAWKMGLKCVALYRDGCKLSQPLSTSGAGDAKTATNSEAAPVTARAAEKTHREMPARRRGLIIESSVGGQKVFLRTSEYDDGTPGEVFIDMHKEGASFRSLMNCFALSVSLGLQHGVPLQKYVDTFTFTRFEPNGLTRHPNIKISTSVVDFAFRVLAMEYLGRTDLLHVKPSELPSSIMLDNRRSGIQEMQALQNVAVATNAALAASDASVLGKQLTEMMGDAPPCNDCGHITVRSGACYKCVNCGNSMGCS